ncbi:MAG: hypothetical protein ACRESS_00330 [Stenotrophobium sp.]
MRSNPGYKTGKTLEDALVPAPENTSQHVIEHSYFELFRGHMDCGLKKTGKARGQGRHYALWGREAEIQAAVANAKPVKESLV